MKFAVTASLKGPGGYTTAQLRIGGQNLLIEAQSVCGALTKLQVPLQEFETNLKHGIRLDGISLERVDEAVPDYLGA